jgi:hypothetical protein
MDKIKVRNHRSNVNKEVGYFMLLLGIGPCVAAGTKI